MNEKLRGEASNAIIVDESVDSVPVILEGYLVAKASQKCHKSALEDLDEEDPENASQLILANIKDK